jgi:hypothetical protein
VHLKILREKVGKPHFWGAKLPNPALTRGSRYSFRGSNAAESRMVRTASSVRLRVAFSKNWADRVDQGEVLKFDAVLRDLPGQPRGIMISANGYQRGALDAATACAIAIYELNQAPPSPPLTITYTGWAHFAIKEYRINADGKPFRPRCRR